MMWVHREGVQLGSPAHTQRRKPDRPTPINSYGTSNTALELKKGGWGGGDGGGQRGAPNWGRAVDVGMSGGCAARQPGAHAEAQTRQTNSYRANTATPIEANTAFELKRGGGGWDGGGQRGAPSWGRAVDVGISGGCAARQPGAHAEALTQATDSYQLLWQNPVFATMVQNNKAVVVPSRHDGHPCWGLVGPRGDRACPTELTRGGDPLLGQLTMHR